MAISDLTGTTWVFNQYLSLSEDFSYLINFTNDTNYTVLQCQITSRHQYLLFNSNGTIVYDNGVWSNQAYRTITITGGTDATSIALIDWLTANATQQLEPTVTYDLTQLSLASGTHTITVKAKATGYQDSAASNSVSYTVAASMPVKGDIITMNVDGTDRQFRVIAINGTVAEVVAMFSPASVPFNENASCFLAGTKITLADGTKKNVEDIDYDDIVKTWNFDKGEYDTASICWITKEGLFNDHYYQLTFSDGEILKTTGKNSNHRVYNVDQQKFVGVSKTKVGDRVFKETGIVTVTNVEYITQEVFYYNLITSKQFDCFANGVLTSDRYGNMYEIDANMKFIKDERPLRPYSEFEAVGIKYYWYEHFRLAEQTESLDSTVSYVNKCEAQMKPLPEEE